MGFLSLLFFSVLVIFAALGWVSHLLYHASLRRGIREHGTSWGKDEHRAVRDKLNECFARICDFQIATLLGLIGDAAAVIWYAIEYSNFL